MVAITTARTFAVSQVAFNQEYSKKWRVYESSVAMEACLELGVVLHMVDKLRKRKDQPRVSLAASEVANSSLGLEEASCKVKVDSSSFEDHLHSNSRGEGSIPLVEEAYSRQSYDCCCVCDGHLSHLHHDDRLLHLNELVLFSEKHN